MILLVRSVRVENEPVFIHLLFILEKRKIQHSQYFLHFKIEATAIRVLQRRLNLEDFILHIRI